MELADGSTLSFTIDETNSSAGADYRTKQAGIALQPLMYANSVRRIPARVVKQLKVANDACWREAA